MFKPNITRLFPKLAHHRFVTFSAILSISLSASYPSMAQDTQALSEDDFQRCKTTLQTQAREHNIQDSTISNVLGKSKLIKRVIKSDRNQPEFVKTFPDYFGKRVTSWRINKGRALYQEHKTLLDQLVKTYGVPAQYLIAFWGLETNFGGYKGKMPVIDSLATLACDKRRSEFFTKELMLALQLYEREKLEVKTMVGSWAGAMGHTQFMPSAYMQYAKDGDNDGRADLWNSIPDALTSAANFLQNLGWVSGYRWGREVTLPDNFSYQYSGKDQLFPLSFWHEQGLMQTNGDKVANADIKASLLIPAGHQGPAFLAYDNFDVIMKWNRSEFYAIAVGHLADRIAGATRLSKPLPTLPAFTRKQLEDMQHNLNQLGFDVGTADGIMGPATRKGVRLFQASVAMTADGFPNLEVINAIADAAAKLVQQNDADTQVSPEISSK